MPNAEKLIWQRLRKRQVKNKRFLRQYSIGNYVIDFYCPELKLAIEVDGDTHDSVEEIEYDKLRETEIMNFEIKFLRVRNEEVFENLDEVILKIEKFVE